MDHPFFDGNKRTALMSAVIFLERNGYEVIADSDKMYKFVKKVVVDKLSIDEISKILEKLVRPIRKRNFKWNNIIKDVKRIISK